MIQSDRFNKPSGQESIDEITLKRPQGIIYRVEGSRTILQDAQ